MRLRATIRGWLHSPNDRKSVVDTPLGREDAEKPASVTPVKEDEKKPTEGTPSAKEYAIEGTKQTLEILATAASLAPVPLLKEVLELGVSIIKICQGITEVNSEIRDLKNRITEFLLLIAKFSKEDAEDAPHKSNSLDPRLQEDLCDLRNRFATIIERLNKISSQNGFLTGILSAPNQQVIEDCVVSFQDGIDQFQTLRDLRAAEDLFSLKSQLADTHGLSTNIAKGMQVMQDDVHEIKASVRIIVAAMPKQAQNPSSFPIMKMPPMPRNFLGRVDVVGRLTQQLAEYSARICILGPGGMGKTSTAVAVMNHPLVKEAFVPACRHWIPCISAYSPNAFLTLLARSLGIKNDDADVFQSITKVLEEDDKPRILIFDNFETAWHPIEGDQSVVKLTLEMLDLLPHISILITMRSEFAPLDHWTSERLSPLNSEHSCQLYASIDTRTFAEAPDLEELMLEIGHLPYAIELMAKRAKRSLSTPTEMLVEWKKVGPSMISRPEEGMERSIELSIQSKFVQGSPGAIRLLQVLSMLPSGVDRSDLSIWVDLGHRVSSSEALETLRDAALVVTRDLHGNEGTSTHLYVLPVVQSYMNQQDRIPSDIRDGFHDKLYQCLIQHKPSVESPDNTGFGTGLYAIASQETNLSNIITKILIDAVFNTGANFPPSQTTDDTGEEAPPEYTFEGPTASYSRMLSALVGYAWYQFWTKPQLGQLKAAIAVAKQIGDVEAEAELLLTVNSMCGSPISRYYALTRASELFQLAGNWEKSAHAELEALMYLRDAMEEPDYEENIKTRPHLRSSESPTTFISSLLSRARRRLGTRMEENHSQASFLNATAYMKQQDVDHPGAVQDLQQARDIYAKSGKLWEAAACTYSISRCLGAMGKHKEGLEAVEETLRYYTSFESTHQSLVGLRPIGAEIAISSLMKARYMKALSMWDGELTATLCTSLEISKELGFDLQVALVLEEMGEIYVMVRNLEAAKEKYEEAIARCEEERASPQVVGIRNRCRNNLLYILALEGTSAYADLEFMAPARC